MQQETKAAHTHGKEGDTEQCGVEFAIWDEKDASSSDIGAADSEHTEQPQEGLTT